MWKILAYLFCVDWREKSKWNDMSLAINNPWNNQMKTKMAFQYDCQASVERASKQTIRMYYSLKTSELDNYVSR